MRNTNVTVNNPTTFDICGIDLEELLCHYSIPLRAHSRRVAVSASIMAEYAGDVQYPYGSVFESNLALISHLGGTCHDIGKLLLPSITPKDEDFKQHPEIGADFLEKNKNTLFDDEFETKMVIDIVRYHHERPDGSGYPYGLKSHEIPFAAGLCSLAEWLDNRVTSKENPASWVEITYEIRKRAGTQFCESAVRCFECAAERLMKQYEKWKHDMI